MTAKRVSKEDRRIIDDFLNGSGDGYSLVVQWVDAVLKYHGWGNRIEGSDVRQETLEVLLKSLREELFDGDNLKSYVQAICKYRCIEELRRSFRRERLYESIANDNEYCTSATPEMDLSKKRDLELLTRIMAEMPSECCELLHMRFQDGKSHKEISQGLGISEGACRVRIHRCLEQCREILKKLNK